MARRKREQLQLAVHDSRGQEAGSSDLPEAFRRLYYHLYTHGEASRAERILEDLSLLLLLKFAADTNGGAAAVKQFRMGEGSANELLMPVLRHTYPALVDEKQHFNLGAVALRGALAELEAISLKDAPAHVLGEAFQALVGPRLRGDKGQFFTPRSLVRAMVEIVAPEPRESVLDPACGTGGFLAEVDTYQKSKSSKDAPTGRLVGFDKDHDLYRLASAMLKIAAGDRAKVFHTNSLDERAWDNLVRQEVGQGFDVVLTNPPFGARIGLRDEAILSRFALGHRWVENKANGGWDQTAALLPSQDPQVLFLELCVRNLKPGGRMGIVLPEGLFGNKKTGFVWDWLRSHGSITALLDCPRTTFQPGTDTKTNVLFFRKGCSEAASTQPQRAKVAVALSCGHDRRGRMQYGDGRPYPDDFPLIAQDYSCSNHRFWRDTELSKPYYLVPRYYIPEEATSAAERELTRGAKVLTLRQLVRRGAISIRKGHEVGSAAYGTGDIPFVRTSDISNYEISTDPTKSVSEEIYEQYRNQQQLKSGDILIVVDGRYRIGSTAVLTDRTVQCVVQSHIRILSITDPEVVSPYELLFALNLPSVRLRMRNLVFVQSTLGTLGNRLLELEVPVLHGPGPWAERVSRFEDLLLQRDRLLGELEAMSGPTYEL